MKRAGTKTTALIIALSMLLTCCTWLTAVFGVKTARAEGAAQWTPDTTLLRAFRFYERFYRYRRAGERAGTVYCSYRRRQR